MQDWWTAIDLYCERIDSGLWSEPVNFWSNVGFILAGIVSRPPQGEQRRASTMALCILAIAVGIGSGLFHSFANRASQLADVIPIGIFIGTYLWLFLRNGLMLDFGRVALCFGTLGAVSLLLSTAIPPSLVNGSQTYFGAWLALVGLAYYAPSSASRNLLTAGAVVFAFSLFFRSIDLMICSDYSVGTHFLWHLLNGFLLYLCIRAYRQAVE